MGRDYSSESEDDSDNRNEKPKKKPIWKKIMKFMFSHVGLCILLFAYICLGAAIFMAIEGIDEVAVDDAQAFRDESITLRNITWAEIKKTKNTATILETLENFDIAVKKVYIRYSYVADTATAMTPQGGPVDSGWTFSASMLFCASIITLIGYGNVYPVKMSGMIAVMVYALIGVPLTLMFLANVGELMATFVRKLTRRVRGRKDGVADVDSQKQKSKAKVCLVLLFPLTLVIVIMVAYILLGAGLFYAWEQWSIVTGSYFAFQSLTTIGFGDYYPNWDGSKPVSTGFELFVSTLYIFIGLAIISMGLNLVADEIMKSTSAVSKRLGLQVDEMDSEDESRKGNIDRAVRRNKNKI